MRELRSTATEPPPFSAAPKGPGLPAPQQPGPRSRFPLGPRIVQLARNLLTGVGALTVVAFAVGVTPIPEKIGDVTGRIASATITAQTRSQAILQGQIAQSRVPAEMELQAWQIGLQGDLATLSAALDGVKTVLVQKANADLQSRNNLMQLNAQLQFDRVKQIMEIKEQLERGNITTAQALDLFSGAVEAMKGDASRWRLQSQTVKAQVLDSVSRVTPISSENGSGITDPLQPGGVLDADVQTALGSLESQLLVIKQRFATRPAPLRDRGERQP